MTNEVIVGTDWLREQIASGVEGYLQTNAGRISEEVAGAIIEQLLQASIVSSGEDDGSLSVRIELPDPDERGEAFMRPGDWLGLHRGKKTAGGSHRLLRIFLASEQRCATSSPFSVRDTMCIILRPCSNLMVTRPSSTMFCTPLVIVL
jgi:hypothetical protein